MNVSIGTRLSRYEIHSKIGEGGMGEVYLAEDTSLHCKVALKILPKELASNGYLAMVLGHAGQFDEARKLLEELKNNSLRRNVPSIAITFAHMGLNQKEEAMAMLQKEVNERGFWATSFAVQPELDEFRGDPRFKALLRKMNLPD